MLRIVEEILSSKLGVEKKEGLLDMLNQKFRKQMELLKKCFTKKEQQKVFDLLLANHL